MALLDWLRREALSNPVILRESGLAYCPRELGMNPGRGKLLLTSILAAFVLLAPFVIGNVPGLSVEVGLIMSALTIPVVLLAAMFDAPRAFSGGTDRAYTEDLLLTPLGSGSIAHGKVFARGLPVFVYAASIAFLGALTAAVFFSRFATGATGKSPALGIAGAFGCILGAALIVRCYLRGLRAGLNERHVALKAIGSYLTAILFSVVVLCLAAIYTSSELLPRRGLKVLGVSISFERDLPAQRAMFRGLVVLSIVPFLYLWCRSAYDDLVASLDRELRRRLRLLDE